MFQQTLCQAAKKTALAIALACTGLAASAADFSAGMRSLDVPYHGGKIEASVWYPTRATEAVQRFGPYAPQVALGAPLADVKPGDVPGEATGVVAKGRFPVVLVSHGTGGTVLNHHLQAEALARAGFVVVSLLHPGDNYLDRSLVADPRYLYERPRQLSTVLDALLMDPAWKDRVDAGRVGAIGHSAGGYSVAALIGGVPDGARLAAHCKRVSDDPSCALQDPSLFAKPSGKPPLQLPDSVKAADDVRDTRIRAAMLMAPFAVALQTGSLKNSTASVKLIGAEHDEVLPAKYHFDYLRRELVQSPDRAASRVATGAGHYAFMAPFLPEWKDRMGEIAVDAPGFDRKAMHEALATETVDFFREALKP